MTSRLRVLLVDDQELVRAGFKMIIDNEPDLEVVAEAGDGRQAVVMATELAPDVILMDVRMPVMDGLDATREICAGDVDAKVIMLTTFDIDDYVYEALRAGASGFLLKDTPPDDLLDGIRVVAGGDALLAPSVTRRVIEEFAKQPTEREIDGIDGLTERELEVLQQLARGLSNAEMAEKLFVSETTVKTHVSHILTKLSVRDRVQAVVAAYESGLVVPGQGD